MADPIICPFCGYRDGSEYNVQLHIEEYHTDDSPFVAEDERPRINGGHSADSMPQDIWTRCTRAGCGEHVLLQDVDEHLDLHAAAAISAGEAETPPPLPARPSPASKPMRSVRPARADRSFTPEQLAPALEESHKGNPISSLFTGTSTHGRSTVRKLLEPKTPGRLGKKELGPYAFERRMPDKVRKHLLEAAEPQYAQKIGSDGKLVREAYVANETVGLIPILADLCSLDEDASATYLCHPSVRHIQKLNCEGNFCGYWNIQTLLTYIQHVNPRGPQEIPDVIRIQELIEQAWSRGYGAHSRVETGGILNTRKWIGSQEALAFFQRINVGVEALVFGGDEDGDKPAVEELLDHVEAYFISGADTAKRHRTSYTTRMAPIYFQRFGHSMTIVGIERKRDGARNLLVFDSSFATSQPMKRLLIGHRAHASIDSLLKSYRRSDESLSRWDEFEIVVPQTGC